MQVLKRFMVIGILTTLASSCYIRERHHPRYAQARCDYGYHWNGFRCRPTGSPCSTVVRWTTMVDTTLIAAMLALTPSSGSSRTIAPSRSSRSFEMASPAWSNLLARLTTERR